VSRLRDAKPGAPFDHVWFWRSRFAERNGTRCRVITRGKKNSVLVQFEDGFKVVTSRYAVRKIIGGE